MLILVIEDEKRLNDALKQILMEQKYSVDSVFDGRDGLLYAQSGEYDIIIMDIMLPSMNGFEIVRDLRKKKINTPIIMLTAKDALSDKIKGLDLGADDYMTKPFAPDELLARVRALSRRQSEVHVNEIEFGDLCLDLSNCDLISGTKSVHLSHKEFELMRLLMLSPRILISKDQIIVKIWGYDSDAVDNNVEAYISFLRKKLIYLNSRISIVAQRKLGYRLEDEPC